ncbi:uncharacterized protein LOC123675148 isoform X2 [Harmonia axyridis]|uniref:uncharacterized protein LOC123675148 isoform X2 n=1 Tax=Harmonia axyridis TaxID=115357 RepID=UPI001E277CE7|nr:uncharacterized protein LOC123675148 isoform X2 [Harmonia axyridis]
MPSKCFLCGFTYIAGGEVSLHRLPSNQLEREKWLQRISWNQPMLEKKKYFLCSNHFPEDCFRIINLRKRLIQGSLPSTSALKLEIPLTYSVGNGSIEEQHSTTTQSPSKKRLGFDTSTTLSSPSKCASSSSSGTKNIKERLIQEGLPSAIELEIPQTYSVGNGSIEEQHSTTTQSPSKKRLGFDTSTTLTSPSKCASSSSCGTKNIRKRIIQEGLPSAIELEIPQTYSEGNGSIEEHDSTESLSDFKIQSTSKKLLRFDTLTTNDSEEVLASTSPSKCASFSSSATSFPGEHRISKIEKKRFFSNPRYMGDYTHRHLENPMLRKKYFELSQRILSDLKTKNKLLTNQVKRLKSPMTKLQEVMKNIQHNFLVEEDMVNALLNINMPSFCCVVDCGNRRPRDNVKFFRIPAILNFTHKKVLNELSKLRREKWLSAIRRADLTEKKLKNAVVCSKHFVTGKPAGLEDDRNPDWVPSISMGYTKTASDIGRFNRGRNRKKLQITEKYHPTRSSSTITCMEDDLISGNCSNADSMDSNILMDRNVFLPTLEQNCHIKETSPLTQKVSKSWKRSSSTEGSIGVKNEIFKIRKTKSLSNLDIIAEMDCSEFPLNRNQDEEKLDTPENSSIINNGFKNSDEKKIEEKDENVVEAHQEDEKFSVFSEKVVMSKSLYSHGEDHKDNKEEMGRCLNFIERDLMRMIIRVNNKRYKVDECQILLTPLTNDDSKEVSVVSIKNNDIYCEEPTIRDFLLEGQKSYKDKLIKELGVEREIEYVSVDSHPSSLCSSRSIDMTNNSSASHLPERLDITNESSPKAIQPPSKNILSNLMLEDLPENLIQEIQFIKKVSSQGSECGGPIIPSIPGMKTVPLYIPPSTAIAGHLFVPRTAQPSRLYYLPQEMVLEDVQRAINKTSSNLEQFLKSSSSFVAKSSTSSPNTGLFPVNGAPPVRKRGRPPGSKGLKRKFMTMEHSEISQVTGVQTGCSYQNNNGCKKLKNDLKSRDDQDEVEEHEEVMRETRIVPTMVVCDYCEKSFKVGTSHKCFKKKALKKDQKVLNCEICDRSFSKQAHLSNHMRSHREYLKATVKCELCNKRFNKKGEIALHRAEYHPETLLTYSCNQCDEKFNSLPKLEKHKKTHAKDFIKWCSHCSASFELNYFNRIHQHECEGKVSRDDTKTDGHDTVILKNTAVKTVVVEEEDDDELVFEEVVLQEHIMKLEEEENNSNIIIRERTDSESSDQSSEFIYGQEVVIENIENGYTRNDIAMEEMDIYEST